MAQWTEIKMRCPACITKKKEFSSVISWVHGNCGAPMEISDFAEIRCTKCNNASHIQNWRWSCPNHGKIYFEKQSVPATEFNITVAAALTAKMGKKWLMTFLDHLGEW